MPRWLPAALLAATIGGGCDPVPPPTFERAEATIFVSSAANLRMVPGADLVVAHPLLAYDTDTLPPRPYYAFRITVSTTGYLDLRVRWREHEQTTAVRRVMGPPDAAARNAMARRSEAATGSPDGPASYERSIDRLLQEGQPLWWPSSERLGSSRSEVTMSVLVPTDRVPGTLVVHTVSPNPHAPTGTPLELPIDHETFEVAVIGDSMLWGQGLVHAAKTTTLLEHTLERRLERPVRVRVEAHSGAVVGTPQQAGPGHDLACSESEVHGEIPRAHPTLWCQLEQLEANGDDWDLLLVQGCINDVDAVAVVSSHDRSGTPVSDAALSQRIATRCGARVQALLERARVVAPHATILVLGYPWLVSERSVTPCAEAIRLPRLLRLLVGGFQEIEDTNQRAGVFQRESDAALLRAVQGAGGWARGIELVLAEGFDATRAAFAREDDGLVLGESTAWLSGVDCAPCVPPVGAFALCPEWDDEEERRVQEARIARCRERHGLDELVDRTACMLASALHPNEEGARAYHDAIVRRLERRGVLP